MPQADRRPFSILRLLTQDWLSFLEDEKNDYNSFALCAEVKLKEALRLSANVEREYECRVADIDLRFDSIRHFRD